MLPRCKFLKSVTPVRVYKSMSAIYMTCLSKLSKTAFVPECSGNLAVEEAIVEALDESIMPQEYAERQEEARELLHRSQAKFRQLFNQINANRKRCCAGAVDELPFDPSNLDHYPHTQSTQFAEDQYEKIHIHEIGQELFKLMVMMIALIVAIYLSADFPF